MCLSNEVKVMSFNIRVAGKHDGINRFDFRQQRIRKLLKEELPDVIGFQETVTSSREWIRKELADEYDLIGCGRNEDCAGEGIPIAYRRDRFALVSLETFWLSDTPTIPGSRFEASDQSRFPRLTHIALLKPHGIEGFFCVVNTHLDHIGSETRKKELEMLKLRLQNIHVPSVLLGDFNAEPQFRELSDFTMQIKELGWKDATVGLGGTFHRYGKCDPPIKIDYIFTNCPFSGSQVVITEPENGVYDSDHYALTTQITVSPLL